MYKIYVGNIDEADVEAYVNTIADRFKRMPIIDPQTGQIDLRYNQLSNDQDFFIPLVNSIKVANLMVGLFKSPLNLMLILRFQISLTHFHN